MKHAVDVLLEEARNPKPLETIPLPKVQPGDRVLVHNYRRRVDCPPEEGTCTGARYSIFIGGSGYWAYYVRLDRRTRSNKTMTLTVGCTQLEKLA